MSEQGEVLLVGEVLKTWSHDGFQFRVVRISGSVLPHTASKLYVLQRKPIKYDDAVWVNVGENLCAETLFIELINELLERERGDSTT